MQLIDPKDIHSAADTWSGFIYQGKIALYHVLKLILEKAEAPEYHLQLDSLEDFAIIRYDVDDKIEPVTLHQVKAMKSRLYSSYEEAFKKLEKRIQKFPCEGAFFHMATKNEKSKEDIEGLHPAMKLYDYSGDSYCNLNDVDIKLTVLINQCLQKYNLGHCINAAYTKNLQDHLESMISDQIIAVHACNHQRGGLSISEGAYYFTIPIQNFINVINVDLNQKLFGKDYYLTITKVDINRYYQYFCFDNDALSNEIKEKLSAYLVYINSLTHSGFEIFVQSIMPQRVLKLSTLQEYKDSNIQVDEIRDAFMLILSQLRDSDKDEHQKIGWKSSSGKQYYPTTIHTSNTPHSKRTISKRILETVKEVDLDVPFNSHTLISEGFEVESIEKEANDFFNVEEEDQNYKKITNWGKISIIPLEKAIQELYEDNN